MHSPSGWIFCIHVTWGPPPSPRPAFTPLVSTSVPVSPWSVQWIWASMEAQSSPMQHFSLWCFSVLAFTFIWAHLALDFHRTHVLCMCVVSSVYDSASLIMENLFFSSSPSSGCCTNSSILLLPHFQIVICINLICWGCYSHQPFFRGKQFLSMTPPFKCGRPSIFEDFWFRYCKSCWCSLHCFILCLFFWHVYHCLCLMIT